MNEWIIQTCNVHSGRPSRIWGTGSRRAGWGGYTSWVVREVRWVFSRRLKVSSVFDSLIAAGNSFQIVGAEKLKERLLKLVVQKGIDRRFWLAEWRHREGWYMCRRFLRYGGWFVDKILYVKRASLYWMCLRTGSQWRCVSLLLAAGWAWVMRQNNARQSYVVVSGAWHEWVKQCPCSGLLGCPIRILWRTIRSWRSVTSVPTPWLMPRLTPSVGRWRHLMAAGRNALMLADAATTLVRNY